MGKRGPAPKPTNVLKITGSWRAKTRSKAEPKPKAKAPVCPEWLSPDAKAKWAELVPELLRMKLLTVVDGDVLAAYCEAWAEFRAASKTIAEEGRTFTTEKGYVGQHPAVAQQRSAWAAVKSFASLFGLDPSSRSRLNVGGDKEDDKPADPFEAFLKRGSNKKKA